MCQNLVKVVQKWTHFWTQKWANFESIFNTFFSCSHLDMRRLISVLTIKRFKKKLKVKKFWKSDHIFFTKFCKKNVIFCQKSDKKWPIFGHFLTHSWHLFLALFVKCILDSNRGVKKDKKKLTKINKIFF